MNNDLTNLKCPVCDHDVSIPTKTQSGDRATCPNCFAQLKLEIENGKKALRCALCITPKQECRSSDCERKMSEREKRGFFDVKL